jgi:hypothetical protein
MKKGLLSVTAVLVAALAGNVRAEGPTVSGFVDVGYNYNLNKQQTNVLRGFDETANSITLQNAEIDVAGETEGGVGYGVDVMYGYDAIKTQSGGFITDGDGDGSVDQPQVDIQQAFINFACPLTQGTITLGKFATMHGAEVIEAKDNMNASRGFLFNYAIPFTHTGVKYDKGFADGKFSTTLAVTNGWDNLQDNNKGKTIHAGVGVTPNDLVSLVVSGAYGPEQTSTTPPTPSIEKNGRSLVDAILTVTPTDKLTLLANYDWGVEEGLNVVGAPTASWQGLAAFAKYAFTDMFSAAYRWETFDDNGGSRTGTEQVLNSNTLTLQAVKDSVTYRLEYRADKSTQMVFTSDEGVAGSRKSQSTIGAQVVYAF